MNLSKYLHQRVLVLRPCDPPCSGCTQAPDPKRPWHTPPTGKLWNCSDAQARIVTSYEVVDLDGYLPPDLARDPNDVAPADLWPACGCCDLSEPQLDYIRDQHPALDPQPWGEPFYPQPRAEGAIR